MLLSRQEPDRISVRYIHLHKTADLITAGVLAGMSLAGADTVLMHAGLDYGTHLGLAFQITDDLLDIRGDAALTGKTVGKDQVHGKMTWPYVVGPKQAESDVRQAILSAVAAAEGFGRQSSFFQALARSVQKRVK
jgi:geranylgeranyl diphosphate synthase type II